MSDDPTNEFCINCGRRPREECHGGKECEDYARMTGEGVLRVAGFLRSHGFPVSRTRDAFALADEVADLFNRFAQAPTIALEAAALDLREHLVVELARRDGEAMTPDEAAVLMDALTVVLEANGCKWVTYGPRAKMRILIAGDLARRLLEDALEKARGS